MLTNLLEDVWQTCSRVFSKRTRQPIESIEAIGSIESIESVECIEYIESIESIESTEFDQRVWHVGVSGVLVCLAIAARKPNLGQVVRANHLSQGRRPELFEL